MHILVTGGAGFIGSNLVRLALEKQHTVTVLDDLSTGYRENIDGLPLRFVHGSLLDADALSDAMCGADSVVHLAALGSVPRSIAEPMLSHAVNATGTLSLLEAARAASVNHVVTASSSSVYGMNPELPKNERAWVRAMSPYAVTKLAQEQYTLAYQQCYGISSVAFRFFNVYGPRQMPGHAYAAVVPIFMDALMRGQCLPVHGDGTQSRDFTFVGTLCQVLMDTVERQLSHPEPVNLAFGTNTSLLELIDELEKVTGLSSSIEYQPPRSGDVRASMADNAVLRELFPEIKPVSLTAGLGITHEWMARSAAAATGGVVGI